MTKFRILIPLDGSEKSTHSIDWLKSFYSKEDAEITLINIAQVIYTSEAEAIAVMSELGIAKDSSNRVLDEAAKKLVGYDIEKLSVYGTIADKILKEAVDGKYDMIVMTKSSVKGVSRIIGSVTSKVVRNSPVAVVVVPE
ncbi:MAG: universal stress protein [Clostridiaceae bacterium]